MAKIKFGSVITDSRGHVDGVVYKWSRFGNVANVKRSPTLKLTPSSSLVRARFANYSKRWWSILTPTQRDGWRALAAANPRPNVWGADFPLTGHGLYIAINSLLNQGNFAGVDAAPVNQTVTPLSTLTLAASAPSTLSVTFTPSPLTADHLLYLTGRANYSPGVLNITNLTRFIVATNIEITSPYNAATPWATRFGAIQTGRQQAIRGALLNTTNGALSPALIALTLAT